jgi:adenylate kinase
MSKVIITGTPGSGKTTILSKLSKEFRIVSIGTEMMKRLSKRLESRDDIRRNLSHTEIKAMRKIVLEDISKINENIIIESHTSIKNGKKYELGFFPEDFPMLMDVTAIIYIDASPNDILLRRINDKTRSREAESADEITEQRSVNLSLAAFYAQALGTPLYIIINRQDMVDTARKEVEQAIKESFSQ